MEEINSVSFTERLAAVIVVATSVLFKVVLFTEGPETVTVVFGI